jgi:hypothetical protein
VNSPEKRAAWKAAFLKPQETILAGEVSATNATTVDKKSVRSESIKIGAELGRTEWL